MKIKTRIKLAIFERLFVLFFIQNLIWYKLYESTQSTYCQNKVIELDLGLLFLAKAQLEAREMIRSEVLNQ